MPFTLEDVVRIAQENHGLNVTEENRPKYIGFIQRQLDLHKYDLNERAPKVPLANNNAVYFLYLNLVGDKLLLFARLIREERVTDEFYDETILDSDEKLKLLQAKTREEWTDERLKNLYRRRDRNKIRYKLMRYTEIIDDIGKDRDVVEIWGRELSYEKDFGGKKHNYTRT